MNCTIHARHLGRKVTLTTTDGRVEKIDREESMPIGVIASVSSQPVRRDDISVRFQDGSEMCLSVMGRGFNAKPGQNVTAVRAYGRSGDPSLLYCYNHQTRQSWFNRPAFKGLRKRSPIKTMLWLLPMIVVLGAWLSPAQTRADMSEWVAENSGLNGANARADSSVAGQVASRRFGEPRRAAVKAEARPASLSERAGALVRSSGDFAIAGWRERRWTAFAPVAAILVVGCAFAGHLLLVVPSSYLLRRRIKRLASQHRRVAQAV